MDETGSVRELKRRISNIRFKRVQQLYSYMMVVKKESQVAD